MRDGELQAMILQKVAILIRLCEVVRPLCRGQSQEGHNSRNREVHDEGSDHSDAARVA